MLDNFAFIIHPIDPKRDVQRKYPVLGKVLPVAAINFFSRFFPPVYISHITGVKSQATGKEIEGWFVACPFTPQRMMTLPPKTVYGKIVATAKFAQKLGAKLVGLGAYTSVVGDGGLTISRSVDCPVTTGDSYTVAVAVQAVKAAAQRMDIDLSTATAAIVGATGSIGAVAAELLARDVPQIILIGRKADRLMQVKSKCEAAGAEVQVTSDLNALRTCRFDHHGDIGVGRHYPAGPLEAGRSGVRCGPAARRESQCRRAARRCAGDRRRHGGSARRRWIFISTLAFRRAWHMLAWPKRWRWRWRVGTKVTRWART